MKSDYDSLIALKVNVYDIHHSVHSASGKAEESRFNFRTGLRLELD